MAIIASFSPWLTWNILGRMISSCSPWRRWIVVHSPRPSIHIGSTRRVPGLVLVQVSFGTGAVGLDPAEHERGSHGWSLEVAADGAAIVAVGAVAGVVVGVVDCDVDGDVVVEPPAAGALASGGGAITANWVPVTTVT
jgi:hypothetical protein